MKKLIVGILLLAMLVSGCSVVKGGVYSKNDTITLNDTNVQIASRWHNKYTFRMTIPLRKAINADSVSASGSFLICYNDNTWKRVTIGEGTTANCSINECGVGIEVIFDDPQKTAPQNCIVQLDNLTLAFD